ncbi:hypothetical protein QDA02_gp51 [Microbacterium phage Margaery]|uniref:Uncharacterized protein n=1 Tax=Microbacterium phage Margaery TaxID=2591217 RepID=A0A514DHN9_9CAUD|nr:hypothetical protein QDA02_gp51 [Microbacterium phage Margaery]QDH93114.1 hypothetical protein PBI_MARGAERY_57 [Microbacterium phage Margaery]
MSDAALEYDRTEGHNHAPASIDRAIRRARDGSAQVTQTRIMADLREQGYLGSTCHEAEARLGMSHESYSGARTNMHARGDIVRLTERRDRRHVYVLPEFRSTREAVPFRPNRRRPDEATLSAAHRLERWAAQTEGTGMLVTAPDYDDIRALIAHTKGTP